MVVSDLDVAGAEHRALRKVTPLAAERTAVWSWVLMFETQDSHTRIDWRLA